MALDTEQKRGSAIGVSIPGRQWIVMPGTVGLSGEPGRLSVLTLVSQGTSPPPPPPATATGPTRIRLGVGLGL